MSWRGLRREGGDDLMRKFILAAITAATMALATAMTVGAGNLPPCC